MSVAYKEKIKIPPQALEQLIVASGHDIRQVMDTARRGCTWLYGEGLYGEGLEERRCGVGKE